MSDLLIKERNSAPCGDCGCRRNRHRQSGNGRCAVHPECTGFIRSSGAKPKEASDGVV